MNRAILVKSCQKNRERREAIDATWANELRAAGVNVVFATGGMEGSAKFSIAGKIHGVIVESGDDYGSNSQKLRKAFIELLPTRGIYSWFICDDDTFILPQRWLAHEPAGEFECRLYHPKTDADVKRNQGRPWACGGAGWYMSRRLCELYVEEVTARCSWDDILATQVAQRHGVEIIDRPDLYSDSRYSTGPIVADVNNLITCHPCDSQEMVKRWEAIRVLV